MRGLKVIAFALTLCTCAFAESAWALYVAISAPESGSTFTASANITITADAFPGTYLVPIVKVEVFAGEMLIGTDTSEPYGITWNNVSAGTYTLTAKVTDTDGNTDISDEVLITVNPGGNAVAQVYYIVPDQLNTPRVIANQARTTVWRWDQGEPFGSDVPNNNPSGAGAFEFPLRFPGQYFDLETNLAYNYFRYYDPAIGRYVRSDLIGLGGGVNLYGYVWQSPLSFFDSFGLECWWLDLGNAEKCDPTGLRRQKPTQEYTAKEGFPIPDPLSPSLGLGPVPPMPEPGMKLLWRTVFKEKGYWEAEFQCKVFAAYVCKDGCGKITYELGNRDLGRRWEKEANSEYDEVTGYGLWSTVGALPGPWKIRPSMK